MQPDKRTALAERRWRETYQPPARVSGEFITPIPPHVYAGVGGFKHLNGLYKQWRVEDDI